MNWYVLNKDYVKYLKLFSNRVPDVDYKDSIKLFLGPVSVNDEYRDVDFYIPLSSYKEKFDSMHDMVDLFKIADPVDGQMVGVLNINNMIPAPKNVVKEFTYDVLQDYRPNASKEDLKKYYDFVMQELKYLNNYDNNAKKIAGAAFATYDMYKNPKPKFEALRSRCCNFVMLESLANSFGEILGEQTDELVRRIYHNFETIDPDISIVTQDDVKVL